MPAALGVPTQGGILPQRSLSSGCAAYDHRVRRRPLITAAVLGFALLTGAALPSLSATAAPTPAGTGRAGTTAPVFTITKEGLTAGDLADVAARTGISAAELVLEPNGTLIYAPVRTTEMSKTGAALPPMVRAGATGKDEDGNTTTPFKVNAPALKALALPSAAAARALAATQLPTAAPWGVTWATSSTFLEQYDVAGTLKSRTPLETTVTGRLTLNGAPVVGPGAVQRIAYGSGGAITSLVYAGRTITQDPAPVAIIPSATAKQRCLRSYPAGTPMSDPRLVYVAPALSATDADGIGTATKILPAWACVPTASAGEAVPSGILIPAAPSLSPTLRVTATREGTIDEATIAVLVTVTGGTDPKVTWSSPLADLSKVSKELTGNPLDDRKTLVITFTLGKDREGERPSGLPQAVTATVTDANGMTLAGTVNLQDLATNTTTAIGGGRGGSFSGEGGGELACCSTWACASRSALGFRDTLTSSWTGSTFDYLWTYNDSWETDYRSDTLVNRKGIDGKYADEVDVAWYTGHGTAEAITFPGYHWDTKLEPREAFWGNTDLEWLMLQSCDVLKDVPGKSGPTAVARWGRAFGGLHLLNGFATQATCGDGSFGPLVARYLNGSSGVAGSASLTPQPVVSAWALAAILHEPAGHVVRTIAPIGKQGVTPVNDSLWGRGTVGPDIRGSGLTGFYAITSTV